MVTKEEIYRMSKVAKIYITEEELLEFTKDINDILKFVDTKSELNHKDDEFCSLHDLRNVFREDKLVDSLNAEEVLQNTVIKKGNFFAINSSTGG